MLHKSYAITDAKADGDTGTFEATVAVFGNVDSGGDRILPHAFDQTLAKWRTVGDPIPVIFNHEHDNAMAHVGYADPNDVQATPKGLRVKGTLDIGDNPVAKQVHRLMKRRQLKEFSFGYRVPKGGEKRAADGANELSEIELLEVGPCLKGMNDQTELHAVKGEHPRVPTHTELHARLVAEGIIARPADLERTSETARDTLRGLNAPNGNHALDDTGPRAKTAEECACVPLSKSEREFAKALGDAFDHAEREHRHAATKVATIEC